ncbi:hypothetical protein Trydic_g7077 [Trypoxylus dichotomus]
MCAKGRAGLDPSAIPESEPSNVSTDGRRDAHFRYPPSAPHSVLCDMIIILGAVRSAGGRDRQDIWESERYITRTG